MHSLGFCRCCVCNSLTVLQRCSILLVIGYDDICHDDDNNDNMKRKGVNNDDDNYDGSDDDDSDGSDDDDI